MNRYVIYNFVLISLLNLMLFVPNILFQYRYKGAVASLIAAAIIGTTAALLYIHAISKFPSKGVPEILFERHPRWIVVPVLISFAFMWFTASSIALASYALLINRFFNPDANTLVILSIMAVICVYAATRSTLSMMFNMEIILLVNTPLILLLLIKASRSKQLYWDEIRTASNYFHIMPKLAPLAAATFIFTGYINLSIYNRAFPPNFTFRLKWLIPTMGIAVLAVSYFVPIGLHGTDGVGSYLYVWTATADSLVMEYGFIERVLFVFLILYLNLTLVYTASGWHQAMELVKSCFPRYKLAIDEHPVPMRNYVICSVFAALTILSLYLFNEKEYSKLTEKWLILRMFVEYGLVIWIFLLSLTRRKAT
ncbi:GerAB/ArcD/ProY family transporter [Paenibacillus sp. MMS18-CY102]|uniref:GerAB/ArcD/ProY family transporter n=1 Tax=Paenibacillus sp. MMS18-CY102 TaxID=2682849 RepID=UPI001365A438|nr:GerAB/ArcD/ProY family transporter [Paenibacillus sp. MMS18-CY102]MWC28687.1 GerAB/ArcD/ProY family transporter [Paenibacillus sp. MMS18-CY102]